MPHDDDDDIPAEPMLGRECLIETSKGTFVKVTLSEAICAIAREILAENGGIKRGESVTLLATVDERVAIQIVAEHPDDAVDLSGLVDEEMPGLVFEDDGRYGPS